MKYYLILISFLLFSCTNTTHLIDSALTKEELLQTDIAFSRLSKEQGRNRAFLEYMADDAVMLRTNHEPIKGKKTIKKLFDKEDDSGYTLTWKPLYADIAESGELGYTYGIYELKVDEVVEKGTYTSVWKKNKKGEWKFVLDTGNKGLGKE